MEFTQFKQAVQRRFNAMVAQGPIFQANIDRDTVWETYLSAFPEGTNPVFRERTEHDCSCCKAFIRQAGGMVQIVDGQLLSLWDLEVAEGYQPVADALATYVKSVGIENVYMHPESTVGTDKSRENLEDSIRTWDHFHLVLPATLQQRSDVIGPKRSEYQAMHDVLLRSLEEITPAALDTVRDLIAQNSLYRGAEKKNLVDAFAKMKVDYAVSVLHGGKSADLFAWSQVVGANAFVCKIRNDVIGTLLVDLSEDEDIETAVKKFEDKVSGTNYKRPTALVTQKMRDDAKKKIEELGFMPSLERRFAKLEDISVTNVLFADRSTRKRMGADVFDSIPTKGQDVKTFDKVEEIPIEKFISDVLPTAQSLEVLVENKHTGNFVSLIAPYDLTAKSMFKWRNPFSWSYSGDVADSIKERVKAAGGNVTGDVCCRLAWFNFDDLDFHMREPDGTEIYYVHTTSYRSNGQLDVDMNAGYGATRTPVENIFYEDRRRMPSGVYGLFVRQFHQRESDNVGFDVEIDVLGTIHRFAYDRIVKGDVNVADIIVSPISIDVVPRLPSTQAKKDVWGIKTQEFLPVTALMLSPNHWDGEGVGNKHYFFMLEGCKNDGSARGFYNEFLSTELEPHRKTMELVGSKTRTEESDDQMSGLGFSSTQRNSVIVRIQGSFTRTVKVTF